MTMRRVSSGRRIILTMFGIVLAAILVPPLPGQSGDQADLSVVHRIRAEAFDSSKVMEHVFFLSDVYGPRLTNSPGYHAAAAWAVKRMHEYGVDARFETWGRFGPSWTYSHFEGHLIEPQYAPLIGFPLAWSPGTNGTVLADAILALLRTEADVERFKGKLSGKIVLLAPQRAASLSGVAAPRRLTTADLEQEVLIADPSAASYLRPHRDLSSIRLSGSAAEDNRQFAATVRQFIRDEAPLLVLQPSRDGSGGTVFGGGVPPEENPPPTVVLAAEHYNRIVRLLEHGVKVTMRFDIRAQFLDAADGYNVIAEIPGTSKKVEIVMLGAHLDSWIGGTGATDDAAGCAVAMEAMRILKALRLPMDRTVRLALWSGEEEGLLGSRGYVREHFGTAEVPKPEHGRVSVYFNMDNGPGRIRGVYLQDNGMVRPTFEAWLEPFRDLGASTLSIRNNFGSDQGAFDLVGIPAFAFIQDPLGYMTRNHHSNMDLSDYVEAGDLMQASAVLASLVYHSATREQLLPRKSSLTRR